MSHNIKRQESYFFVKHNVYIWEENKKPIWYHTISLHYIEIGGQMTNDIQKHKEYFYLFVYLKKMYNIYIAFVVRQNVQCCYNNIVNKWTWLQLV